MCVERYLTERGVRVSVFYVAKVLGVSEGSETLFRVWYKICGGVRVQSGCFVCGKNILGSEVSECLLCV